MWRYHATRDHAPRRRSAACSCVAYAPAPTHCTTEPRLTACPSPAVAASVLRTALLPAWPTCVGLPGSAHSLWQQAGDRSAKRSPSYARNTGSLPRLTASLKPSSRGLSASARTGSALRATLARLHLTDLGRRLLLGWGLVGTAHAAGDFSQLHRLLRRSASATGRLSHRAGAPSSCHVYARLRRCTNPPGTTTSRVLPACGTARLLPQASRLRPSAAP